MMMITKSSSSTYILLLLFCFNYVNASMFDAINVTRIETYLKTAPIPVYNLDYCQTKEYCNSVAKNGICDPVCDTRECDYDGGDCREVIEMLKCPEFCQALMANDICNLNCNVELCGFDGGDCIFNSYIASQGVSFIFETTQKVPSARMLKEKLSKKLNLPVIFEVDPISGSAGVHLLDLNYKFFMVVNPASALPNGSLLKANLLIDFRYCATPNAVCRFSSAAELVNWINAEPIEYLLNEFDIILYQAETTTIHSNSNFSKFMFFGKLTPMIKIIIVIAIITVILVLIVIIICCQSSVPPVAKEPVIKVTSSESSEFHCSTPVQSAQTNVNSFRSQTSLWTHHNSVLTSPDEFFSDQADTILEINYTPQSRISKFCDSTVIIQKHTMHHFTDVTPKKFANRTPNYRISSPISMISSSTSLESVYESNNYYNHDDTNSP